MNMKHVYWKSIFADIVRYYAHTLISSHRHTGWLLIQITIQKKTNLVEWKEEKNSILGWSSKSVALISWDIQNLLIINYLKVAAGE